MITKRELIEKIMFLLAGGDNTADLRDRYHDSVIEAVIGESMDAMLQNAYRQSSYKAGAKNYAMLDNFTKTYGDKPDARVLVQYDENREEYYCDLPVKVVYLDDNDGIRLVCDVKDQTNAYAKVTNTAYSVYAHLPAGKMKTFSTYYPEEDRIFIKFRTNAKPMVLVKAIPSFDDRDDNDIIDEVHIIGKDGFMSVTDRVRQILSTMPATKTSQGDNLTKSV